MNTLICLLSGQPIPNLMSCIALQPDRIVLVQTFKMRGLKIAKKFRDALKKLNITAETLVVNLPEEKDNEFPFLLKFFRKYLLETFSGDSLSLNLTGGTKPMSIALYETCRTDPKAEFFYFDVDSPCEIIDFCEGRRWPVGQIPLDAFLAGYGYQIKNRNYIVYAENLATERAETTRVIARNCNSREFQIWGYEKNKRAWIEDAINNLGNGTTKLKKGILMPSVPEITTALAECFHLKKMRDGNLLGDLTSHDVKYLDGGWLEEFIWFTLYRFRDKYQLADLHLGQIIQRTGTTTMNELDVSFMRNNTFYHLECKTGFQEKLPDRLYKIYAVSKQLQAIGTKTFLISNSPNIDNPETQERARLHSTRLINALSIHNLAINPDKELEKIFTPQKS